VTGSDEVGDIRADESPIVVACGCDVSGVIDGQIVVGGDGRGMAGERLVDSLQRVGTCEPDEVDETLGVGGRALPDDCDIGYLIEREVERGEQDHVVGGRLEDRPSSQVISILGIERG